MDKSIEVEYMDLSQLSADGSFVLIHVSVGNMPPGHVQKRLEQVKRDLPLCKLLEKKMVKYAVVACSATGIKTMQISIDYTESPDDTKETITNFDDALKVIK